MGIVLAVESEFVSASSEGFVSACEFVGVVEDSFGVLCAVLFFGVLVVEVGCSVAAGRRGASWGRMTAE